MDIQEMALSAAGVGSMGKTIKIMLIVVVIFIVMGTAAFFIGKYLGKKDEENGDKGIIPAETDWGAALTIAESEAAQSHARKLYEDMKGLNMWKRDIKMYSDYLASSDRVFVATANYFDDNYGGGDNLAKWIDDENFFMTNLSDAVEVADSIIERLAKFGIIA
ncbi:MAG: hypothetical protein PHI42_06205 [Paludibacteraceae bacterium]|nr:hypothetical protein [Paludibacteraceae bacterium]